MQSVAEIVGAVGDGRKRPEAFVAEAFERIAAGDAAIGAFEILADRDAALAEARSARGPLAGVALAVKDIFETEELPTGCGSEIRAGRLAGSDAALVAMARAAGATVVGKSVTTEYAFLTPAGTRNPRNREHTPGGSSSGSAAAVAAGFVPAALGTQTGGSIIRPAAYCGVAGYKPSFRMVPTAGVLTFAWSLDTAGFFAASVADVALLAAGITGRPLAVDGAPAVPPRLGLYRSTVDEAADPDMRRALEEAGERARRAGADVREVAEPAELAEGRRIHATIQNYEAGRALLGDYRSHGGRMSQRLREAIESGLATGPEAYDAARAVARRARRAATALFADLDALIAPAATGAAPAGLASTGDPILNKLWTLTGNPCVNVPGLRDGAGMPLGIQVIARFGNDPGALAAADWLEARLGE